jgi:TATA-binding protein-associated factor Taf7
VRWLNHIDRGSDSKVHFRTPRKRRRSVSVSSDDFRYIGDKTGSPLSKRLKLSRDRRGQSGLKVEVFQNHSNATSGVSNDADDDDDSEDLDASAEEDDRLEDDDAERRAQDEELEEIEADMRDATDDEEGESDESDDDDFLARDIEFG